MITSGEQPMIKENSNDGAMTRVLELYGKPVDNVELAHQFHLVSEKNYGFAGKIFINFLVSEVIKNKNKAVKLLEKLRKTLKQASAEEYDNSHLDNIAIVCLGDYYSSIAVFGETKEQAWNEALDLGSKILENNKDILQLDTVDRAWDFVMDWIAINKNRFVPDSTPCYGKIEEEKIYIIPSALRESLEESGFNYLKVTRGFKENGLIETVVDNKGHTKMQVQKWINGINKKCFCIKVDMNSKNNNSSNPLI